MVPLVHKAGHVLSDAAALTVNFAFQYVVLLGLFQLDSYTRPLRNVAATVLTTTSSHCGEQPTAVLDRWHAYHQSITKDVDTSGKLCATVMT